MSLEADAIVDRRRLKRKLTFWRIIAFVILVAALLAAGAGMGAFDSTTKRTPHIARIAIDGVITDDRRKIDMIDKVANSKAVKGVILSINSPGGTTTGGENLYNALRRLAAKKPMVAEIRTLGASAGYMAALSSDHIFARYNSITASIGVLFQFGNAKKLLDTIGVQMDAVKSAPLKASPDYFSEPTPEAKAMLQSLVNDSYAWFVNLVAERRHMTEDQAKALADGKILSGHQALEKGLVDEIGGEKDALDWLKKKNKLKADLPVVTWEPAPLESSLPFNVKMAKGIGIGLAEGLAGHIEEAKGLILPSLTLDGLVSVWHAPLTESNDTGRGGDQ